MFKNLTQGVWQSRRCIVLLQANRCKKPIIAWLLNPSELPTCAVCFLNVGNGISVEGALLTEQDVNHPKPAKRARTSFTADQLQVDVTMNLWFLKPLPTPQKHNFMLSKIMFMFSKRLAYALCGKNLVSVWNIHLALKYLSMFVQALFFWGLLVLTSKWKQNVSLSWLPDKITLLHIIAIANKIFGDSTERVIQYVCESMGHWRVHLFNKPQWVF